MITGPPPEPGSDTGRLDPLPRRVGVRRGRRGVVALALALAVVIAAALVVRSWGDDDRPAGVDVYRGLGAWVDVFDYTSEGGRPPVGVADVDAMAAQGVRTIYLHAAFNSSAFRDGVVGPDLVLPLLQRAHERGLNVVGWYAPRFLEPSTDLARLLAIARFERDGHRFDGVAVDIEDRGVEDIDERNRRLVELSRQLRDELGEDTTIGAVVLPTVLLEKVNRDFWPRFPWAEIAPFYDVWLPMTYWTDRLTSSGYRDPERLITESTNRMRELIRSPDALVHPIGGIGDKLTEDQLQTYVATLGATAAIGGSIYDYRTMPTGGWGVLRGRVPS